MGNCNYTQVHGQGPQIHARQSSDSSRHQNRQHSFESMGVRLHVLNGLGTRGVLIGPAMAKALFENIELGISLDPSIDIKRFDKKKK